MTFIPVSEAASMVLENTSSFWPFVPNTEKVPSSCNL